MAKKPLRNGRKIIIRGRRYGKKAAIAGFLGVWEGMTWIDEAEEIPQMTYEKLLEVKHAMAGEMTASEARERMARERPSRIRDMYEQSHRIVHDLIGWDEFEHLVRRGMDMGEIVREAIRRHEGRLSSRTMEMAINPPLILRENASELWARAATEHVSRAFADNFINRSFLGFDPAHEPKSRFPEYSDEKFENMGKEPMVKEIMPGAVKLTKKQANERIKIYLEA